MTTSHMKAEVYQEALTYGENVYKQIFPYELNTPDFENLELIFIELFDINSVICTKSFDVVFFNLFKDKHNYIKWTKSAGLYEINPYREYYVKYAIAARSYFFDEDAFTARVISFSNNIYASPNPESLYAEEIKKLEHMIGIYDVDEARILDIEQKMSNVEMLMDKAHDVFEVTEKRLESIDKITKSTYENIRVACDTEVNTAKMKLNNVDVDIQRKIDEYASEQRSVILFEKDELLRRTFSEAEAKLSELRSMSQLVVNSARAELTRINQESGDAIYKIGNYIDSDDRVKQLLSDAEENKKLMEKIEKLTILNDQNIDRISETVTKLSDEPVAVTAPVSNEVVSSEQFVVPSVSVQPVADEETISDVNYYLNESICFSDRYNAVMERKRILIEQGEYFHEMFDDVLVAVMENANPYLIGPTGCGKTYLVNQIARLLDVDFIDIGYINEEYDILGFQTANGGYSKPNFYRCYKYGKIAFCDELDNGNSKATVKLNSFLSNTSNCSYSFPNGENVPRHGNFRMIAAGNTSGNGADSNYNTREKIEESVQQRLMPIYVGYDNYVESLILSDYPDWYEFVILFRRATDAWAKGNYGDAPGIITTRDVARIKKYLDNGSFSAEKIINYEFVQTKEENYLTYLSEFMKVNSAMGTEVKKYVDMFIDRVNEIRNK